MQVIAIKLFWRGLALLNVLLAIIGVVLPGLPTVPFLLLAAWAAGKGWPRLELYLLNHPRYGAAIRRWREHGAIPLRAKCLSSLMMALSSLWLLAGDFSLWLRLGAPLLMLLVALWMWRQPE